MLMTPLALYSVNISLFCCRFIYLFILAADLLCIFSFLDLPANSPTLGEINVLFFFLTKILKCRRAVTVHILNLLCLHHSLHLVATTFHFFLLQCSQSDRCALQSNTHPLHKWLSRQSRLFNGFMKSCCEVVLGTVTMLEEVLHKCFLTNCRLYTDCDTAFFGHFILNPFGSYPSRSKQHSCCRYLLLFPLHH